MNILCWPIWRFCKTMWMYSHLRSWSLQPRSLSSSEWPVSLRSRTAKNVLQPLDHWSWVLSLGRHQVKSTLCWTSRMHPTSQSWRVLQTWCPSLINPEVTQLNINEEDPDLDMVLLRLVRTVRTVWTVKKCASTTCKCNMSNMYVCHMSNVTL